MVDKTDNSRIIADLIAQLGRFAAGEGFVSGLTVSQWTALRYFSQANRFSRTVSAFATFHATTRGTASQTIKSLVDAGYLTRTRSTADGRSIRIDLTEKARAVLNDDPFEALVRAADAVAHDTRGQLADELQNMLGHLSRECCKPQFGMCASCNYLECRGKTNQHNSVYKCGFLDRELEPEELEQICIYHQAQTSTA